MPATKTTEKAGREFKRILGRIATGAGGGPPPAGGTISAKVAKGYALRSGARSTELPHMRPAGATVGSGVDNVRRLAGDGGPLRIVFGVHARAMQGGGETFAPGTVEILRETRAGATLEKGADPVIDPGVYNEVGATVKNGWGRGIKIEIPKRASLEPASVIESKETAWASDLARREMEKELS